MRGGGAPAPGVAGGAAGTEEAGRAGAELPALAEGDGLAVVVAEGEPEGDALSPGEAEPAATLPADGDEWSSPSITVEVLSTRGPEPETSSAVVVMPPIAAVAATAATIIRVRFRRLVSRS